MHYRLALAATWLAITLIATLHARPSEKAINEFGQVLVDDWSNAGIRHLVKAINPAALCARSLHGTGASSRLAADFTKGFEGAFMQQYSKALQQFTDAKLVRAVRTKDDRTKLIIRLGQAQGGFNYHHLLVKEESLPGQIVIEDIFYANSGEWVSDSVRRLVLPMLLQENKSLLEKILSPSDRDYLKHMDTFQKGNNFTMAKEWEKALAAYDSLPESMQKLSMTLSMRANSARNISQEKFLEVIDQWERLSPADSALNLMSIDAHLYRKDYAKAHAAITRLADSIEGDSYLDFLHANLYVMTEDWAQAEKFAQIAINDDPKIFSAWDILMAAQTKQENWKGLKATLTHFDQIFPLNGIAETIDGEAFSAFRSTEFYQTWLAGRAPAAKAGE